MRWAFRPLAFALGAVLGVLAALAVAGGPGLPFYTSSVTVFPDNTQTRVSALCGTGNGKVVGGANRMGTVSTEEVSGSSPTDSGADADKIRDDGWEAAGNADDNVGNAGMTSYAICSKGRLDYRSDKHRLPATFTPATSKPVFARAMCPRGSHVSGGGLEIAQLTEATEAVESRPIDGGDGNRVPDDGWRAGATNVGGIGTKLRAFAVCAHSGNFRYASHAEPLAADSWESAFVPCSRGRAITGGGISFDKATFYTEFSMTEPLDGPDDGFEDDDGWRVGGSNEDATKNRKVRAWAVCRRI